MTFKCSSCLKEKANNEEYLTGICEECATSMDEYFNDTNCETSEVKDEN